MYSSLKRRRSSASAASSLPKSPPTFDSAAVAAAAAQQLPSAPFSSPARPPKKIKKTDTPRIRLIRVGGGGASKKKKQQQQLDDDDGRSSSISAAAAPAKDDLQDSDDDEEMEFGNDYMELDGDDSRKPSAKRRRKKKKRKSTRIKKQELLEQVKNRISLEETQEAKEDFERHRDEILAEIPAAYKNAFGHIGFSRWSKFHQPVLVLSPFDVPSEPLRGRWLEMFEKVKKHDRQDCASWLVYWYGASHPSGYYSLIPPKQKFMTYETAKKKGLHVLPAPVQKKIDENKKLSKADKEIVKAFQEMEEDLEKEPSERKRGILNLQENYESAGRSSPQTLIKKEEDDGKAGVFNEKLKKENVAIKTEEDRVVSTIKVKDEKDSAFANVAIKQEEGGAIFVKNEGGKKLEPKSEWS